MRYYCSVIEHIQSCLLTKLLLRNTFYINNLYPHPSCWHRSCLLTGVLKGKGTKPMKKIVSVFALMSCLIPAGSLAASEAGWEVHVTSHLPTATLILPDPLP